MSTTILELSATMKNKYKTSRKFRKKTVINSSNKPFSNRKQMITYFKDGKQISKRSIKRYTLLSAFFKTLDTFQNICYNFQFCNIINKWLWFDDFISFSWNCFWINLK